jgi:hypothetical protein
MVRPLHFLVRELSLLRPKLPTVLTFFCIPPSETPWVARFESCSERSSLEEKVSRLTPRSFHFNLEHSKYRGFATIA